jgi:hypothetical protein
MTTTSRPVSPAPHGPVESPPRRRCTGDAGEGVISAAIAVLIVAFLGAAMWVGLSSMWDRTETRTNTQVDNIGSDGP